MTISLSMIVKNEEEVLARCLESAKGLFDQIVIVDTGSIDQTKQIAEKYTDCVYDFEWVDDFSKARNFSFSKATGEYIMWLDADDVLNENFRKQFAKLKETIKRENPDVVMMKYDVGFDANGNTTFCYYRERIVKKSKNLLWQDPIHEVIAPEGKVIYSKIAIEHRPLKSKTKGDRNLKIYENLLKKGAIFSPRQQFYYSRELMYNCKLDEAILNFEKFLEMPNAWVENKVSACIDLSHCYLQQKLFFKAKQCLLKSLEFTYPRAQICCEIGDLFVQEKNYNLAIFWYKWALKDKENAKSGAFVETQFYTTYPLLMLSVSYYKLGDVKMSEKNNSLAGKHDPNNPYYLKNVEFFKKLKNKCD